MPHDLITLGAIPPGALTTAEIEATMAYAINAKAQSTRDAYARDWHQFEAWCAERGACPLPAHQGMVGAYLSHLADSGYKASSIGRKAAAIAYRHRSAGHEPPTNAEGVKATLQGIRRKLGTAKAAKTAATAPIVRAMLDAAGDRLIDARDRALLAFGMASAMRRSELAALDVADLTETPDGLHVLIRRSKTDQEGQGQTIAVPRGAKLRPVELLQTWLARAEISAGPVFRHVALGDKVSAAPLSTDAIARVVKKHAARLGLDPAAFGGHSLRSGFVTSAVEANAPIMKIAEQTRHRSLDMLRVYSRRADLFRDHAGSSFL